MNDIAARFAIETADHAMTVLRDDGLYRHLRFRRQVWRPPLVKPLVSSMYWFDLITVPGTLIFQGDGTSFVFSRIDDMFEFFRGPVGRINPTYWAEKVTSGRDQLMRYDREIFEASVKEAFVEAVRDRVAPAGLGKAVREEILNSEEIDWEHGGYNALREFAFYKHDADRYDHTKRPDFEFDLDGCEWNFQDYDWWFLWALHGIVWGIAQYDQHHGRAISRAGLTIPAEATASAPAVVTPAVAGGML